MKKLILAITIVFLLLSCGPTEKEKYEELFDDDNPLIGTWESPHINGYTGKPTDFIVFIDDSTVHFVDSYHDTVEVYTYEFDQTLTYTSSILHGLNDEPAMNIKIFRHTYEDIIEIYYLPNKKILFDGDPWKKTKK